MAKKELFDDSSDDEEDRLHVNKSYAKEYQSRKQHEELLNTTALDEDEDDGSTSESEDEDGELLTPTVDVNILKTLKAVRNRDSSIYDRNQVFYESDDPGDADDEASERDTSRKRKAKRWKDVVRERALKKMEETGTDSGDDDDDDDDEKDLSEDQRNSHDGNPSRLAYNEEQRELRAAFIQSTNRDNEDGEEDDDDMLFVKKQKTAADAKAEKELMEEYEALEKTKPSSNLVDPRGEVKDGEKFLMDFFKHKRWVEEDDEDEAEDEGDNAAKGNKRVLSAPSDDDDDSIAELDKADDFEAQYNFRFEEAAAAAESGADFSNVGYARGGTMQTLRRPDDVRRQKRLERKERKAAERRAKEEQLRRLKNARREQMEGKLREVKKVLGSVNHDESQIDEDAMMKLLEGDYDPDKFEKLMANAYGDEFYKKEDAEWKNDADVRRTLMQDEDDGNALVGQDDEDGGLYDNGEDEYDDDDGEQEGQDDAEGYDDENDEVFAPVDGETSIEKKLKAKMQEELYKLDYEDIVAGMPTRFKYRQVEANNYGLSTQEILFARDSRLKSFVSLKKMAPYRDEDEYVVGSKRRRRFRDQLKVDIEEEEEMEGGGEMEDRNEVEHDEEGGEEQKAKKKRRRQKKAKRKDASASAEEANKPVVDEPAEDKPKKRRRKKGGKKTKKAEEEANTVPTEQEPGDQQNETGDKDNAPPDEDVEDDEPKDNGRVKIKGNAMDVDQKETKTEESRDGQKQKKKKKKKKKSKFEGVTKSRLAAYGL